MGNETIEKLKKLSNDFIEVRLNNIGRKGEPLISDFLYHLALYESSPYLMKLSISNNILN